MRSARKEPAKRADRRPSLITPDLAEYIERNAAGTRAKAREAERVRLAVERVWASEVGRGLAKFVATRPSAGTRRVYRIHLDRFVRWVAERGVKDVASLGPEALAAYEARVMTLTRERSSEDGSKRKLDSTPLALKTRQELVRTVRTAYGFLVDEGILDRNPARHLKVRGRHEPKRTFLDDAQVEALLAVAGGRSLLDARDRSLLVVLAHAGLRAAEAAKLSWADVRGGDRPAIAVEGKGNVMRTVPLSSQALATLDEWARRTGGRKGGPGPVWFGFSHRVRGYEDRLGRAGTVAATGRAISADTVHTIVTKRAKEAGVEATPHTLRRSFATKLKRSGVALDTIQRYLGHANIQTTIRYLSPDDEHGEAAVRALAFRAR